MPTDRLYYHDAERLVFDATVVGHDGDDATRVVLDRTAFYPTSGGQPHDTGTLGGRRVLDVRDGDEAIVHVLDGPVPLGPVHGEVDAARRHDHMAQHTAQHLLSALAADAFGWPTASVHFGAEHSTIEFDVATADDARLVDLTARANAAIRAAVPVTIGFEDAATATGLRKPSDRSGVIRIVTIAGLDRSACGGTHVATTAAIGAVLLRGVERIRGRVRVGFLAGDRVLAHASAQGALLQELAATLSCAEPELRDVLAKRVDEGKMLRERVGALEEEVAATRLRALIDGATPGADGIRRVAAHDEASPTLLRAMAQRVAGETKVLFVATGGAALLVATSADGGLDAGALLKGALAAHGGRGGGSPRLAQGTAPDPAAVRAVAATLLRAGT